MTIDALTLDDIALGARLRYKQRREQMLRHIYGPLVELQVAMHAAQMTRLRPQAWQMVQPQDMETLVTRYGGGNNG
jgi:uncharacterized protein (DUF952 family)